MNKFYVTTPIYYVTAKPHLGSLYSTLLADVASRWNQLLGKQTFFVTGTDEHGQKIAAAAAAAGKKPKEFVDSFIDVYKDVWAKYAIDYDWFIRTTDAYHVKAVQDWIIRLQKKGDIYKAQYQGWYCMHCETFVIEKEAGAAPTSTGPLCTSCGRPTQEVAEETYFFKLSAYQDRLLQFYQDHPDFITPKERTAEVINFVKSGLKDLSISRTTITWGIPFPGDDKHVTYVWADALNNYITAVGYGQAGKEAEFKKWWPADLQILGKDIVRFHAVYWPAFLMASDLALPKQLLVHGWINVNKQKMSKSFGNVIDPVDLYNAYGADAVRYYLIRQIAVTHDSEFSIADLEQKISSDLADDLGNLLNRMISLAHKYNVHEIPAVTRWSESAQALQQECALVICEYTEAMESCVYHMALARLWKFINAANAYFHNQEPWKLAAKDQEAFIQVLSATVHSLRAIAYLAWPVMPGTMEQLLESIGVSFDSAQSVDQLQLSTWNHTFKLKKVPMLFKKPEEAEQKLPQPVTQDGAHAQSEYITIQDLTKVQLLVGTIEQCEPVEQSDKLLKMQVNFGAKGMRQILAGIRASYAAADLIGKQGVFVFNLQPRKMIGLESQGMMLVAEGEDKKVNIVSPQKAVPNGTQLR